MVLGDKAHEISASQNYTPLGYTPEICCGIILVKLANPPPPKPENCIKIVAWGLISNNVATGSQERKRHINTDLFGQ